MKININGKRNISLDFNAPRKFRLIKDGAEIPYIRTGKNSFRLSKNIDGVVDLEEIIEQPRYMQPVQLQPQQMTVINPQDVERLNEAVRQMALVNPNDVMIINQTAEQLEKNQNFIAQTQKEITDNQVYIDQQQQRLNESALGIQALETNNSQRLDSAETSIYSLASDLDIVKNATIENTYALDSIREQELITQASLETKADKTDVEKIKEELEEYKDDNESFKNALSNYSGGLASDSPVPEGGKDGQILTKITNESGVYGWKDSGLDGKQDKLTQTQMDAVNSGANQSNISQITTNQSDINTINGKIPSDASSSNQLADKAWVGNQGYITGITSGDVTTALGYTPYDASNPSGYTSNVGTVTSVNNTSPDGSGNVTITIPDPLPSQSGQNGKYLTTDGTSSSWGSITIPTVNNAILTITQGGVSKGTFTANASSDVTIALDSSGSSLPTQTGHSGEFLTTDGTDASWSSIPSDSSKADRDLSNLTNGLANTICTTAATTTSSATNARPAVIVENYVNGTSWYRVYSDGWCEQGGSVNISGTNTNNTVYFLKTFANTNYNVAEASYGNTDRKLTLVTLYTDKMTVIGWANTSLWRACGYIS